MKKKNKTILGSGFTTRDLTDEEESLSMFHFREWCLRKALGDDHDMFTCDLIDARREEYLAELREANGDKKKPDDTE